MNKFFTIVGVLWLSAQGAFAQGQMNYFSGQEIEAGKPVQLVGAVRNSENLEAEFFIHP